MTDWNSEKEETLAVYLNTAPFVTVKLSIVLLCSAQSQAILKLLEVFVLFIVFNKLAEFWLEIWLAKATAIINHNILAKGIILISGSFITLPRCQCCQNELQLHSEDATCSDSYSCCGHCIKSATFKNTSLANQTCYLT